MTEGSYPYVTGGVSSWIQSLINSMPQYEFIIFAIGAEEKNRGKFNYAIPKNVTGITEVFLDSFLSVDKSYGKRYSFNQYNRGNLINLITGDPVSWSLLFSMMQGKKINSTSEFFMSKDLFDIIEIAYEKNFDLIPFTEFYWSVRSMLLPLISLLRTEVPKADIYHSVSTGYGGVIASLGSYIYNKPYLLTEHGIYTREREEEIIKSPFIKSYLKDMWTNFFYNLSKCSYEAADKVVTLFEKNKEIEIELGCSRNKISIIPNGVNIKNFDGIPKKDINISTINVGAVVRLVPIKDIKTMIQSFSLVQNEIPDTHFYIMGPTDEDEDYYDECVQMAKSYGIENLIFTGKVNVKDYIGKMDIIVLSSISEGQPLAILEGMACGKPFVSTDVGSCSELLMGILDNYGRAGIIVPVMNFQKMSEAIINLCRDKKLRETMGQNALNRVKNLYTMKNFIEGYKKIYEELYTL